MARKDWWYANIPLEQAQALEEIVDKIGNKLGVGSREQLVRRIIADYIERYEEKYGPIQTRKSVRLPNNDDASKPVDAT